jgi:hypothetical protein
MDAIRALRDRGVNQPEQLLEHGTPEQILAACDRWDRQPNVSPGLLVKWIRDGQFAEQATKANTAEERRATFASYARRYSAGETIELHATLQARRSYDDEPCPGELVVVDLVGQQLAARCEDCGYEVAYTARSLRAIPLALEEPF